MDMISIVIFNITNKNNISEQSNSKEISSCAMTESQNKKYKYRTLENTFKKKNGQTTFSFIRKKQRTSKQLNRNRE